ncbi:MAG: 3-keto-5-aminohexanoate cleavage protein [Chloroflexota bacterium]
MTKEREYFPGSDERVLRKVILTAAVTGAVHTPSMSDYLPLTPKQIIADAVAAHKAGAACIHVHARVPATGEPSPDLKVFREIAEGIKKQCDAVLIITTGGAGTPDQRIAVVPELKPEMATLNLGSMNTGGALAERRAERSKQFKYDWEAERLQRALQGDAIWQNTFRMMREYATKDKEAGTKPELEIWDLGQIGSIPWLLAQDLIKTPLRIQFVMGAITGMPATPSTLFTCLEEIRRHVGNDFTWSACVAGREQFPLAAICLAIGGDVRVGLEDNLFCGYGKLAKSSAEQVERVVTMARQLSIKPATSAEARQILGLKGSDKVNF